MEKPNANVKLGNSNLEVSAIGLGCMGMSFSDGLPKDIQEMTDLLRAAVDRGITFDRLLSAEKVELNHDSTHREIK